MNILFVHYGTFSANSMNHMGPFAAELKKQGHQAAIALPELDPTFQFFPYPQVPVFSYEDWLENPNRFTGEPPQIVHAWTPREIVRKFCEQLWQKLDARLIVHLEDNETAILDRTRLKKGESLHKSDLLHAPWFLEMADAATVIIESLTEHLPGGKLTHCLHPGFDSESARKNKAPHLNKADFGIPEEFKVITYPGGSTGANAEDLTDLYEAVHLLNSRGSPCLLLKTGFPDLKVREGLSRGAEVWIRDVGFLSRDWLWRLIEMADAVVQPGRVNSYNQYRLPSKLPDFLCLGKPVVSSAANLGQRLIDGEQALLLQESTAREIAARCQEILTHPEKAQQIAQAGQKAGLDWFDLAKNTAGLVQFYTRVLQAPKNQLSLANGNQVEKLLHALEAELKTIAPPSSTASGIRSYLRKIHKSGEAGGKSEFEPERLQIEFQVYFPNEAEKLELGSMRYWYCQRKAQTWMLPFTPYRGLDWIRLDPGQYPGTFTIKSWAFLDKDLKPLLKWTPEQKGTITCQLIGCTLGPITSEGQEIWSLTNDPQVLYAPLPDVDQNQIKWFTVEFSAPEVELPLANPLKLRRNTENPADLDSPELNTRIETALATLQRRRSPVLRMVDRFRSRIKS